MKPIDFTSWFDEEEATLGLLSTFEFDPVHFESRLLRSPALNTARRILVMVDGDQFQKSLIEKRPARWINQRYLVVPVRWKTGAFHPKLGLLIGEGHARLWCGSNNLTQAGSAHNLELLNGLLVKAEDKASLVHLELIRKGLDFFTTCAKHGEGHTAKIAAEWLSDTRSEFAWLATQSPTTKPSLELVHTMDGTLWDWLERRLDGSPPSKIEILSPLYDSDLRLLQRIRSEWPRCAIEITAQQRTSNLPAYLLKTVGKSVRLFDIEGAGSRRLHAKLFVAVANGKTVCLAGSANFTTAAFDGINVETCLGWEGDKNTFATLFNGDIERAAILADEFEPGDESPPEEDVKPVPPLSIRSALLDGNGKLSIAFAANPALRIQNLSFALQNFGERVPAVCSPFETWTNGVAEVHLKPEHVLGFGGAVACSLIAETETGKVSSPISWLIQEQKLTHDPAERENGKGRELEVRETGRGLLEHLDEIGAKEGQLQLVQYLNNLSIRFDDSSSGSRGGRGFKVQIRDPFRPDTLPDWLNGSTSDFPNMEAAICEFADRHEQKVLRRHARRANINGLPNFLDVLLAVTKLLFAFHRRGIVNKHQAVGRLVRYIDIFTEGFETQGDASPGYLAGLREALAGDKKLFKTSLEQHNVPGHLKSLLLIAQNVRCDPKEPGANRPSQCLRFKADRILECLRNCQFPAPTPSRIREALDRYEMLTEGETDVWLKET